MYSDAHLDQDEYLPPGTGAKICHLKEALRPKRTKKVRRQTCAAAGTGARRSSHCDKLPFMAKHGRHPHNRGWQAGRDKRRRQARPGRGAGPADLLSAVAQRLASGEPLDFLDYVSYLLTVVDLAGRTRLAAPAAA